MENLLNNVSSHISQLSGVEKIKKILLKARGSEKASRPPNPPPSQSSSYTLASIKSLLLEIVNPPDKVKIKINRVLWNLHTIYYFWFITNITLLKTFLFEPLTILFNPVTSLAVLLFYFFVQIPGLLVAVFISLLRIFGFLSVVERYADERTAGWSLFNIGDPDMFTRYNQNVEKAKAIFAQGSDLPSSDDEEIPEEDITKRIKYFNLDVAKTLLLFSSALYERDENLIHEVIVESHANKRDPDMQKIQRAEIRISGFAHTWGLEFSGISDLNTYGGAFAGLWWDPRSNWIVVSFKGTTPLNGSEWLKDLTLLKTNAGAYLFGCVHQGTYDSLFPDSRSEVQHSPYAIILKALTEAAQELKRSSNKDIINVYVTGHSLGGGIAQAFYARAVKSPTDFGPNINICNAYVFGAPRIGDVKFAADFFGTINVPFGNPQTLFRVVNNFDAVSCFPVALGEDPSVRDELSKDSLLNFAHIGEVVVMNGKDKPVATGNTFAPGVQIKLVQTEDSSEDSENYDHENGIESSNTKLNNVKQPNNLKFPIGSNYKAILRADAKTILSQVNPTALAYARPFAYFTDHLPPCYMENLNLLTADVDIKHG